MAHPTDLVLPFQLRDYQTDLKLCNDIFDNNPTFQTWVQGDQNLYLYLDSLDEGLLTIPILANILVPEFKKYPADRLYLRIACRTAEWPTTLTTGIQEHWGKDAFKAYELLPLRAKDIEEAVHSEGMDQGDALESEHLGAADYSNWRVSLAAHAGKRIRRSRFVNRGSERRGS